MVTEKELRQTVREELAAALSLVLAALAERLENAISLASNGWSAPL